MSLIFKHLPWDCIPLAERTVSHSHSEQKHILQIMHTENVILQAQEMTREETRQKQNVTYCNPYD